MSVIIRLATSGDLYDIVKLLAKGKLNHEGIAPHVEQFLVVEKDGEIVGTAGWEKIGQDYGLLRSLALDASVWNTKIVLDLLQILLKSAEEKAVQEVFLLTGSAVELFEWVGFRPVDWKEIPHEVKQSSHFKQAKEGLSTAMRYTQVDNQRETVHN
ncbi:GNAT family N-acetyltransferase [Ammoniphilus resinae]|uniref:N-acetylglutamate synthase-like GNAT family acetyltransferase n=1 Tax=Ammoniphilus resinae TaxID=861532 RepID=A0ABS4GUR6_9BACL|nr:GNAT family N-acetyltransferase [Ammoniphilus resinae]MBP1934009.1 N-acetylglutamate synthase-like GNAT family acetyltransferase [Ammoniphilus resinae]